MNTLVGQIETKHSARYDAKHTFEGIQTCVVHATSNKNEVQIG